MAGHDEHLTISFHAPNNSDSVRVRDEALEWYGWDGQQDRAVFARGLIRKWAAKERDLLLRPGTAQQAQQDIDENFRNVD